jgi:hypothetical protein
MISILSPNAVILRSVPCASGESLPLPREFADRQVDEVWRVTNECALRVTGPVDRHNANRAERGHDWVQNGSRLSYHPSGASSTALHDILVTFTAATIGRA